ncbi:ROK family protein [Chitinispirillales bacterium ANBcel5]|uniref:ROK family protein n=1 Tax=Cellulosispirillum alkaliphilum TaxID=3039283 RepID=UPI002A583F56|nr:ROK family protein [Chitinispirillales bacterium ANBcel5]
MEKVAIGIDLGGTNLKGIILTEKGESKHVTRIPTEAEKGGARVMENILTLIGMLVEKNGGTDSILGVGIGTPGFIDQDGLMLGGAENLPGWKGTQVFAPIMEKYGLKATGGNDVTVTALAELRFGAGKGVKNMVCFALGTGIGGGIALGGKLYKGSHGMAGELGHIVVETNGLQCNCGQKGCVERYASATGIVNLAKSLCTDPGVTTPFAEELRKDPSQVTSKMVYDYVAKNDYAAVSVHKTATDMLARAVGITLNSLAPDRVVLGGGVMMAGDVILDAVKENTKKYCWPAIYERCDMTIAQMGEDAGVMGSAAMVFDEFAGK